MCEALHSSGFWADFIDPLSGKPVSSNFTGNLISLLDVQIVSHGNLNWYIDKI